jgi:hypothetical protein
LRSGNFIVAILLAVVYIYAFIGLNRQSIRMIFGRSTVKNDIMDLQILPPSSISADSRSESKSERSSDNQNENWASVIIPLVNLAISLIIGIYMFPVILQSFTGLLSR